MTFPSIGQHKKFHFPEGVSEQDYVPNLVVIKMAEANSNPNERRNSAPSIEKIKKLIRAKKIGQPFPSKNVDTDPVSRQSGLKIELSNIYKIYLDDNEDIVEAINLLLLQPEVLYAEPYYYIRPLDVPNDPGAQTNTGSQEHLAIIKAYDAWDITKGDTSVVIGII
ncbi:MAG: hypothetical protein M3512_08070, partial [Bacteroidota bacterium]|nr:hypothetical protein [Bacteroidota bacterium]